MIKQAKDFPDPSFFFFLLLLLEVYLFLQLKAMFLYLKDLSFACHWLAAVLYYESLRRLWRKREVKDVIFLLYKGGNGWFRFFFFFLNVVVKSANSCIYFS